MREAAYWALSAALAIAGLTVVAGGAWLVGELSGLPGKEQVGPVILYWMALGVVVASTCIVKSELF